VFCRSQFISIPTLCVFLQQAVAPTKRLLPLDPHSKKLPYRNRLKAVERLFDEYRKTGSIDVDDAVEKVNGLTVRAFIMN
jgi:hypothetical protein